jgi:Uma2 family endonuclease
MALTSSQLKTPIIYPDTDGSPMAESDPARDYLIYSVEALSIYFQNRDDIYVSGNLFIYYKQGVPSAVVAPDVFVIFGVPNKKRLSYKVWEENNKAPDFILEITSLTTQENDEQEKPLKYAQMGVREYFQYDPTGDYLQPPLKGSRLVNNGYQPIPETILPDGVLSIHSQVLGLDLRLIEGKLRFYNPQIGKKLLSHQETEQARREAIPRLRDLGLSEEQIAAALSFSLEEVRQNL